MRFVLRRRGVRAQVGERGRRKREGASERARVPSSAAVVRGMMGWVSILCVSWGQQGEWWARGGGVEVDHRVEFSRARVSPCDGTTRMTGQCRSDVDPVFRWGGILVGNWLLLGRKVLEGFGDDDCLCSFGPQGDLRRW